jgi:hypothetical protein
MDEYLPFFPALKVLKTKVFTYQPLINTIASNNGFVYER